MYETDGLLKTMTSLGLIGHKENAFFESTYKVIMDGRIVGFIEDGDADEFCHQLRCRKVLGQDNVCFIIPIFYG